MHTCRAKPSARCYRAQVDTQRRRFREKRFPHLECRKDGLKREDEAESDKERGERIVTSRAPCAVVQSAHRRGGQRRGAAPRTMEAAVRDHADAYGQ